MSRRALLLTLTVAVVLGVGLLYLQSFERRSSSSSASAVNADQTARTRLKEAALQPAGAQTQTVTLYFPSYAEGKLVPESRSIALTSENTKRIRQVLLALIEGSHEGKGAGLPPSTTIRAVFLSPDGTAVIDLSRDALSNFTVGIESETLAVYSIVDSLCANIPAVKQVKFLVQGQEVQTLDGHIDLTGSFAPEPSLIAQSQ